jgi:uncharacterized protein YeaO (DUF488 family)
MTELKTAKRTSLPAGVFIKRAYAAPEPRDGMRVLVDRIWPRGLRKDKASIDLWMKDIAPSTELRRWFHHDPARWSEFRRKYTDELREKIEIVDELRRLSGRGSVTLLFAAHDVDHNNAVVLQGFLLNGRRPAKRSTKASRRQSEPRGNPR